MTVRSTSTAQRGGLSAFWDAAQDYIRVVLQDVEVEAPVGLHPWERHPERLTRLVVNVEMFAPIDGSFSALPEDVIDYDRIRRVLKGWPTRPHTLLLETLVDEVTAECFKFPTVAACRVSIVKPDIFNEAAGAGIEVYRVRPAEPAASGTD